MNDWVIDGLGEWVIDGECLLSAEKIKLLCQSFQAGTTLRVTVKLSVVEVSFAN
jgi:hypothetical protein